MVERKPRVVLYDPAGHGGVCHYTYHLAEYLSMAGAEVTVVTKERYELERLPRRFKLVLLFKRSWVKGWISGLARLFRGDRRSRKADATGGGTTDSGGAVEAEKSPLFRSLKAVRLRMLWLKAIVSFFLDRSDVIHFQWCVNRAEQYRFMRLLKLFGFKLVYTAHDLVPLAGCAPQARELLGKIYRLVDRVVVHSQSNQRELAGLFDLDPDKIAVIPHGTNDLFNEGREVSRELARRDLGIGSDKKVILFFGLIRRYKGLEYLVEAFERAKENVGDLMLLVVGQIYKRDPEGYVQYARLLGSLSGRRDVLCIPEYVPVEKMRTYFAACDVVALPYVKSYTSGVLLSAYTAGKPVIASDTGGLGETVEVGKSGYVVPPGDVNALAQAIEKTFAPGSAEAMGRHAGHLAATTYSWKTAASKTIDLYGELKAPRRSAVAVESSR